MSINVTDQMVASLNLTTGGFAAYFPAYCLNPPLDDGCPYGYCPNPDIGGFFTRISTYLTNFLVAIIIFHYPEGLSQAFWSQILSVYSLLLTCGISIGLKKLTRIHAILATALAGSPLSLYIVVYAIRSMWSDNNRLSHVLGPGQIVRRIIVFVGLLIWIGLVIYIIVPSDIPHFAQQSCEHSEGDQKFLKYFYFLPLVLLTYSGVAAWVLTIPLQLAAITWFIAIWLRRREIWPRGEKFKFHFYRVWRVVNDNYPFLQFTTVVFLPFYYWVVIIEIGSLATGDELQIQPTFGQVLAMFVTLPPLLQVAMLVPRFCRWFIDLAWVRFLTCRSQRRRESTATIRLTPRTYDDESYDDSNKKVDLLATDYGYKTLLSSEHS